MKKPVQQSLISRQGLAHGSGPLQASTIHSVCGCMSGLAQGCRRGWVLTCAVAQVCWSELQLNCVLVACGCVGARCRWLCLAVLPASLAFLSFSHAGLPGWRCWRTLCMHAHVRHNLKRFQAPCTSHPQWMTRPLRNWRLQFDSVY